MNSDELRNVLKSVVKQYFAGANVHWSNGNFTKKDKPTVYLRIRNTSKVLHPTNLVDAETGVETRYYPARAIFEIVLVTPGRRKIPGPGYTEIYENTSVADLEDFCNFVESEKIGYLFERQNICMLQNTEVIDVTAMLDGISNEYRAMVEYTVDYMLELEGGYNLSRKNNEEAEVFEPTPSGGGTQELASSETGYFTQVEIENNESEDDTHEQ